MSNFTAGQKVIWLYTPPGGYSYTQRVNATVIRCGPKRVLIECEMILTYADVAEWMLSDDNDGEYDLDDADFLRREAKRRDGTN